MRPKLIMIASWMLPLWACSATPPGPVTPPADLAAACAPLAEFAGTTADDLVASYLDLIGLYEDCSIRHEGLGKAAH